MGQDRWSSNTELGLQTNSKTHRQGGFFVNFCRNLTYNTNREVLILLEWFFALLSGVLLLTSGIENNNSFPHPLSPDKEKEYLEKFRQGDLSARDVLVKHNLRLIVYITKKYTNYPDKDELV